MLLLRSLLRAAGSQARPAEGLASALCRSSGASASTSEGSELLRKALFATLSRTACTLQLHGINSAINNTTSIKQGTRWLRVSEASRNWLRNQGGSGGWVQYGRGSGYGERPPNPDHVLYGIMGVNAAVFGLWQLAPPRFMGRHFMVSEDALREGRLHTLVTAAFSQRDPWHLAGNMLSLYFFGRDVGHLFGGVRLLQLYLLAGVCASASHVLYFRYKEEQQARKASIFGWQPAFRHAGPPALGASGAVNAVVLFSSLLFPWRIIYVNLILPVPSIVLGGAMLMRDVWLAQSDSRTGVGHAAHIGGAAVGFAAWALFRVRGRL